MTLTASDIERRAEEDLAKTGQVEPPFRPSLILRQIYDIRIELGKPRGGSILIPGDDPRVVIAAHLGSAMQRLHAGEEAGHVACGHIVLRGLWQPPATFRGLTLPPKKEAEAKHYARAVAMPACWLTDLYADGTVELGLLIRRLDVPESSLKQRLRELDLWRLTYSLATAGERGFGVAYRRCGWWTLTRQPRYLADAAAREGRPRATCERPGCRKLARCVNHRHYGTPGREEDDDLEALCNDCHYEEHQSRGRIR